MVHLSILSGIFSVVKMPLLGSAYTAKGEDADKILGLNIGADDYVTKPFNPVELQARVNISFYNQIMLFTATIFHFISSAPYSNKIPRISRVIFNLFP